MKNTFKHGQQVQHSKYGIGTFELNEANEFRVVYDIITTDWRVIGNEHYSQLEPIEDLPEIGQYAYFWDEGWNYCAYAKYYGKKDGKYQMLNIRGVTVDYSNISKTPPFV